MGLDPAGVDPDPDPFIAFIDTLAFLSDLEVREKLARSRLSFPTSFQVEGRGFDPASAPLCAAAVED